jgi:hypothetical protein
VVLKNVTIIDKKMKYETLFEYIPGISKVFYLIPLLFFTVASIVIIVYIIRRTKYALRRQVVLFFFYLVAGILSIISISMIINTPKILCQEKKIKDMLRTKEYSIVEGVVENYELRESNGRYFESFSISNVRFEYSDYNKVDGFYQTSKNNGPIKENGQFFKISYYTKDAENLILRIENKDTTLIPR